jgi:hypothetical protein
VRLSQVHGPCSGGKCSGAFFMILGGLLVSWQRTDFLRLLTVQVQAIEALNEQRVLEGASRPLVVKFADSKRHMGPTSGQQPPQSGLMGHAGGRGGPSGGLKSGAGGDGDFQSPYWQMVNAQAGPHGAYPFQVRTPT